MRIQKNKNVAAFDVSHPKFDISKSMFFFESTNRAANRIQISFLQLLIADYKQIYLAFTGFYLYAELAFEQVEAHYSISEAVTSQKGRAYFLSSSPLLMGGAKWFI